MKNLSLKNKTIALAFAASLMMGAGGCSSGTKDGDTNVEESDVKDKNPDEHNDNAEASNGVSTDTTHKMDDAYEETDGDKGARDADLNGKVDKE